MTLLAGGSFKRDLAPFQGDLGGLGSRCCLGFIVEGAGDYVGALWRAAIRC